MGNTTRRLGSGTFNSYAMCLLLVHIHGKSGRTCTQAKLLGVAHSFHQKGERCDSDQLKPVGEAFLQILQDRNLTLPIKIATRSHDPSLRRKTRCFKPADTRMYVNQPKEECGMYQHCKPQHDHHFREAVFRSSLQKLACMTFHHTGVERYMLHLRSFHRPRHSHQFEVALYENLQQKPV